MLKYLSQATAETGTLKANPQDVREQYKRQLKELQDA